MNEAPEAAAIIGELIKDKSQINKLGKEAKKSVLENFSLPKYGQKILNIFFLSSK